MKNAPEQLGREDSDRRTEFRRLMVATVDASTPVPRHRRVVFATFAAALFLVGVLTGGALVASRSATTDTAHSWWSSSASRDAVLQGISGGELIGTSKVRTHAGTDTINLGTQPKGANVLAVSIPCQREGQGSILIDGGQTAKSTYRCRARNGSVSELYTVGPVVRHHLTVSAAKGAPLVITWAWATSNASSALFKLQQQELRQELSQAEQAYNQGLAECASGALSGVACPTGSATPAP
ncbi:MAG TPA: hypothetical protein VHZ98_09210 [Galbitalea sp.]|nr:hypothetical protein [Galbitalea sp.]